MKEVFTKNRDILQKLSSQTSGPILISDVEKILQINREKSRQLLGNMTKSGWLKRVKRGMYSIIPLDSPSPSITDENPFVIASKLYPGSYIGGWSAANYWGLTDQIFNDIWVMIPQNVRNRENIVDNNKFLLSKIKKKYDFGTKTEWFNNSPVEISDPTKTIIDFLYFPELFSATSMKDIFIEYINSEYYDLKQLKLYATMSNNKAIFKRLGYLAEICIPDQKKFIKYCKQNISKGYSKLSSVSDCDSIITRWKLWIPEHLKNKLQGK